MFAIENGLEEICVYICVCVCVCVLIFCMNVSLLFHIFITHTHTHKYIYIYMGHKKCSSVNQFTREMWKIKVPVLKITGPQNRKWKVLIEKLILELNTFKTKEITWKSFIKNDIRKRLVKHVEKLIS